MKKFFILTFGCQMNVYDSALMEYLLEKDGSVKANSVNDADVIILNTCAVREHAVNRVLSRLEDIKGLKRKKSGLRIGVTGCIPQHLKEKLIKEKPFIDFLLGPDNLRKIVSCANGEDGIFVKLIGTPIYSELSPARGNFPEAFVSVMRGCNNFCSYCVVPYTRGRERHRSIGDVLKEVKKLSNEGYKRVIFLGQNVNDYNDNGRGLPYLLSRAAKLEGIERIGFLTSHPAYFPFEVIKVMKNEPKVEKFLHLPLQSGNSKILKLMKRGYTKEEYLKIIDAVRNEIDDITLSTDIIVGFPGETDRDFMDTIKMIEMIGFNSAYMFKYSPRRYTLANTFINNIDEKIKKERLNELIRIQSDITREKSEAYREKILDVLVTGKNEKNLLESNGITVYNKNIIVKERLEKGKMVKVKIDEVKGWTPIGTPVKERVSRGEKSEEQNGVTV